MKKRLTATLLSLCLLLTLLSAPVFAAGAADSGTPSAQSTLTQQTEAGGDTMATPSDAQPEECTCKTLCTEDNTNGDCPVCSAEDAEIDKVCVGAAPMLPVTALAAENAPTTLYVGDYQITSGNATTYLKAGSTQGSLVVGSENDWTVKYDPSAATLTLNVATITGSDNISSVPYGAGIYAQCSNGQSVTLTIELIGENTITGTYGIFLNAEMSANSYGTDASLNITGNGSLIVTGTNSHGLFVKSGTGNASLTINDASVVANTTHTYSGPAGICVQSSVSATSSPNLSLAVDGGSLTASGTGNSDGILLYVGSSQATGATTSLTVADNAIVRAKNGIKAERVDKPTPSGAGIVFDGKDGTVYGDVTLQEDLEIQGGETLTIGEDTSLTVPEDVTLTNNGTITVESSGKLNGTPIGDGAVIDKSSPVSYLDENGTEQSCNDYEVVTANDTQWTTGWYVVNSGVTINRRVDVSGDVSLILTDGGSLTVNGGIHVTGDDRFTVYGQENGTGKLTATATNHVGAGIGGNGSTTTSARNGENGGTIVIAGGTIEAIGGDGPDDPDSPCGGAGIGNGHGASNGGSVTIYGGEVNATGGAASAGIGGDGSTIQILGGTVEATSGGIGTAAIGGTNGAAGTITITDSTVTANGEGGTGIGSGWEGHGGTITITNSTVTAIGGYGAGIGGNVTIVNSTVTASSTEGDSIDAGKDGTDSGTLILSPLDGKAIAAKAGADEASALALNGSPFTTETAVTDLVRGTKYFCSETYTITIITAQPQNVEVKEGEPATFSIAATGSGTLTYQWQQSTDGSKWTDIAGATSDTYTIEKTTMAMNNDQYRCVVTGDGGKAESNAAMLTVNADEPPYTGKYSYEIFVDKSTHGSIDVDRYATEGDRVLLSVVPEKGWLLDGLVITDKNGEDVVLSEEDEGVMSFIMPSCDVTITATFVEDTTPFELPFNDVDESDWFYDPVCYVYSEGLMTGVSATEFAPNTTTTRAMIVSMLARLENVTSAESAGFSDIHEGDWYATAVNWAASAGIVNGVSDDSFAPNAAVTREQLAAMLMNYAEWKGLDTSARADLDGYIDAENISSWATETMSWAVAEGLISGVTNDTLAPQESATRAQVAAIVQRFLEHVC